MIRQWAWIAALSALLVTHGLIWRLASDRCEARHAAQLLAQVEAGLKLDAARRAIEAQRDDLARQLEEQAYADPIIVPRCLGPDRVRRLNSLR